MQRYSTYNDDEGWLETQMCLEPLPVDHIQTNPRRGPSVVTNELIEITKLTAFGNFLHIS